MKDSVKWGIVGGLSTVAATVVTLTAPLVTAVVVAVVALAVALRKMGLWRTVVVVSFGVAVARGFTPIPEMVGYVAQFGPIAIGIVALLREPKSAPWRKSDATIIGAITAMTLAAFLSGLTSVAVQETILQAVLLAVMALFLGLTYRRRWVTAEIIRGDLTVVFVAVCTVQLLGLMAAALGIGTAIADYGRFQGLLTNANYAGFLSTVAIALAIFVFKNHRALALVGGSVALVALILSGSRGAIVATAVGTLVLLFLPAGRKVLIPLFIWVAVPTVALLAAFNPALLDAAAAFFNRDQQGSDITSGRTLIYQGMLERWQQTPWLGTGYRTVETYSLDGAAGHNTYLSMLTEMGIVGALALAVFIIAVMVAGRGADRILVGAACAIAVLELTESSVFGWGGPTALISWIVVLAYARTGAFTSKLAPQVSNVAPLTRERVR